MGKGWVEQCCLFTLELVLACFYRGGLMNTWESPARSLGMVCVGLKVHYKQSPGLARQVVGFHVFMGDIIDFFSCSW